MQNEDKPEYLVPNILSFGLIFNFSLNIWARPFVADQIARFKLNLIFLIFFSFLGVKYHV